MIQDASGLLQAKRPGVGFFVKSRETYIKNGKTHTHFHWTPVTVGTIWVTDDDKKCQVHFIVNDGNKITQIDQPMSKPKYESFRGYRHDVDCIDLIDGVLKRNRLGLCLRRWTKEKYVRLKIPIFLFSELDEGRKKCGQSMNGYCIGLLSGKSPTAALTDDEIELLRQVKKVRSDVQLMFNAMVTEFGQMSDEQLMKLIIHGRRYYWWRDYLCMILEIFDNFSNRIK